MIRHALFCDLGPTAHAPLFLGLIDCLKLVRNDNDGIPDRLWLRYPKPKRDSVLAPEDMTWHLAAPSVSSQDRDHWKVQRIAWVDAITELLAEPTTRPFTTRTDDPWDEVSRWFSEFGAERVEDFGEEIERRLFHIVRRAMFAHPSAAALSMCSDTLLTQWLDTLLMESLTRDPEARRTMYYNMTRSEDTQPNYRIHALTRNEGLVVPSLRLHNVFPNKDIIPEWLVALNAAMTTPIVR